jgi:hypothetical protein
MATQLNAGYPAAAERCFARRTMNFRERHEFPGEAS